MPNSSITTDLPLAFVDIDQIVPTLIRMTDSASTYTVGEEALCYHQHALYLAKILRIKQLRPNEEELRYFVHYPGWNKKWDEWVSPERLFKNTEANRRKHQHRIPDYDKIAGIKRSSTPMEDTEMSGSSDKARKIGGKKKTKPGGSKGTSEDKPKAGEKRRKESPSGGSRSDQSSPAAPGRNRGDLPLVPSTTGQSMQPNQPLTFTRGLKALMVDDFERVTRLQQLVTLPRTPNVANILHLYGQEDGDAEKKDLEVYAPALVAIFDLMLPNALLYRLERAQWASHLTDSPDARPSQVYGYEHLLRLLVQVTEWMDPVEFQPATPFLNRLLKYLGKRRDFFLREYENAGSIALNAYKALA